ncbi:TadA family conjugal transfer-associated ATPase [Corynebacterium testudinoris]|uniref:Helicase/secretion neighborhood ATPase n=1 Tax=Corynebacterium testudinoris TaxID=136857 RepID=A0A0G3H7A8_9CORY|nr:TadA family conjugal transfer-associated ATPase [Corynebacterium testudinoris]AKK07713.1 helicase/secretion neighborhood ATPase [Corynebacterium testudinoris]MBX8995825.1 TadA family conjugal transfer-associated ATPase [Corynebacterium testudinoris]
MTRAEAVLESVHRRIADQPAVAGDVGELAKIIRQEAGVISDGDVLDLLRRLRHDSSGIGALEPLLLIEGVTDIVVNSPDQVFFDRGLGLEAAEVTFGDNAAVRQLATRLAVACGRRLDDAQPFVDGRLARDDGSIIRVHAVLSPPAENSPCLSLRVLRPAQTTVAELIDRGTLTPEIAAVLREIIEERRSFLVVGGTGTGKTTMLSALLAEVDHRERIVCIEDTAELRPPHPHVLNLVSRSRNIEGTGEITMADLLRQALRMRPDRIVVGEIRGAEVVDLLAALNTGHDGGAGTVHANSLAEVPARLEALAALGGLDRTALHSQLAAAVDYVIVMKREPDGTRRVHQIGTLQGVPVTALPVWEAGRPAP